MTTTIDTRFFRAGVGTVIYKDPTHIAFFKRKKYPPGIWQFQQGGIDLGESVEETLWRELIEEVGFTREDFLEVFAMPNWTVYQDLHTDTDHSSERLGQAHSWFFLKLKPEIEIDLSKAKDDEFDEWKWIAFEEAIEATNDRKKHVYETLHMFFQKEIIPGILT